MRTNPSLSRRQFLAAAGILGLTSAAGCTETLGDVTGGTSVEDVKKSAERVSYDELYRNISDYEGEAVYYSTLRISDIASGEGAKEYLLSFRGGGFGDGRYLYGLWDGDPFREDDNIELWGIVRGLRTYNSAIGGNTVPEIEIVAMNRVTVMAA